MREGRATPRHRKEQQGGPDSGRGGSDIDHFDDYPADARIENGAITRPVNECTIAGNLIDMLRRIVPANDAQPHRSHMVPSLLVEGLTLAGN